MKFNIINEKAPTFGDSILSKERQHELSVLLDDMVKGWGDMVRVCNIIEDIAAFCNTNEEFAYCIILHIGFHMKKGSMAF
jgi:hypothetical protein